MSEALARIGPDPGYQPRAGEQDGGIQAFRARPPGSAAWRQPDHQHGRAGPDAWRARRGARHLQAEFRFIVKGSSGAYAVVEGERFPLEAGDLLATPAWTWYDWANEGDEPAYWLNAGDLTLTRLVNRFREVHPQRRQPADKPAGYWERIVGRVRPAWIKDELPTPPMRYPWAETLRSLQALEASGRDPDPFNGHVLMFPHPLTGGPTSPTLAVEVQLLPPGFEARAQRHTSTVRYHVIQGGGATVVEGERLEWAEKDCFILPPWSWHQHANRAAEDAILLSVTDRPIMQAFGFYREERAEG